MRRLGFDLFFAIRFDLRDLTPFSYSWIELKLRGAIKKFCNSI